MDDDLKGILDALLEGVIVLDDADRLLFLNAEAARLLGAPGDARAGRPLTALIGADHPVCQIVERVRTSGRPSIYDELELPQRLPHPIPADVSVALIGDVPGAGRRIAIALRDRSAARSLREEISERERQESYGHIAAGIAHEVKNPLGGIRGAAELLQLRADDDRSKKAAGLIVSEVDRISGLVDELMVFARGDELALEPMNIHQPLDALLDLLELERDFAEIQVDRVYDPSLPEVLADPARIQQVFLNLARNAMQAMEEKGGRLTLSTGMSLEHRLVGPDGRPLPTIEVAIEDTGPGIPADDQHRLSTPFFTTKRKGTGLGLSVARHWIRRHGGRLRIESTEGVGTRVVVHLPLRPPLQPAGSEADRLEFPA
jgi:two-component system nitrogen regulation sensor histidine kinase GlnL